MRSRLQPSQVILMIAAVFAAAVIQVAGTALAEDSYIKDLDIRQKPMVEIKPAKSGTLSVVATLDRPNRTYKTGENVMLKVKANEDCYIWVFDTGTSGKVHQVYPNKFDKKNFLAAGKTLSIPGKDSKYQLEVSPPSGNELITVVASKGDRPLTPDLIDQNASSGPFVALRGTAETVSKDLSITLRKQKQEWTSDQVVFHIKK